MKLNVQFGSLLSSLFSAESLLDFPDICGGLMLVARMTFIATTTGQISGLKSGAYFTLVLGKFIFIVKDTEMATGEKCHMKCHMFT